MYISLCLRACAALRAEYEVNSYYGYSLKFRFTRNFMMTDKNVGINLIFSIRVHAYKRTYAHIAERISDTSSKSELSAQLIEKEI